MPLCRCAHAFRTFLILSPLACTLGNLAADEFPPLQNTEKSPTTPLPAVQAAGDAKVPEGFQVSVFAAEPDVQNPIAFTTDERGRLWVAENYSWAGNSFGGFDAEQRDRIVVLQDSDGDGKMDVRKVFADSVHKLTSVEVGNGGIWALSLPNLLFFPDADRDDIPDGPAQVVLNGIDEKAVGHTPANGLKWGPDGWLYARHGIQATSHIGKQDATDSQRIKINTGVWRYHPPTGRVEDVMHGMTNSWGFDFDQHGEMFVINTVIGHLWHVVYGAHTERMYGIDLNPHAYQLIDQTADHVHWDTGETWNEVQKGISDKTDAAGGGHAHIGMMIYQGDNWPLSYRNRLFTLNLHGMRINSNILERSGTAYVGKRAPDFCFFTDAWYRGMDLITGPDGSVFVADWSDTGECHDHDGVHRTSGRIYKITYGQPVASPKFDLKTWTDDELVKALSHTNAWWPRTARRILAERHGASPDINARNHLRQNLESLIREQGDAPKLLRLLETYHACNFQAGELLPEMASHPSEFVRAAAIRFLVDASSPNSNSVDPRLLELLDQVAQKETSGLVCLHLASSLQRLPSEHRWTLANRLAKRSEYANDRMFPKMLWYGVEAAVATYPDRAIELASRSKIPLLTENIARRLSLEIESKPIVLQNLLESASTPAFPLPDAVVRGMAKAFQGWQKAKAPQNWPDFVGSLSSKRLQDVDAEMQMLRLVFGDGKAEAELKKLVMDTKADSESRRQALRSLLASKPEGFGPNLLQLLNDRALLTESIRGLAIYEQTDAPVQLLARWGSLNASDRRELLNTLASRASYAKALMNAVRDKRIPVSEISAYHARQIYSFENESLASDLKELWGDVKPTSAEKKEQIDKLRGALTPESLKDAELSKGRALFQQNCSNCHILYGVGKKIGPDLTGSNRKNLEYLLENIGDPSASVGSEFKTWIVLLEDDRVVTGVVVEQTERTLTLQTAQERVTLDRNEIQSQKQSSTSLMPDGLLQNLTADQVRDLFGYLMGAEQVPLP